MDQTFWIALGASSLAALVTALGIYSVRRFEAWARAKIVYFISYAAGERLSRKNEEKGSDVNLAMHLLNDVWLNADDCAVIVSNCPDLPESLRFVKTQNRKLMGLATRPWRAKAQDSRPAQPARGLRENHLHPGAAVEPASRSIVGTKIHRPAG